MEAEAAKIHILPLLTGYAANKVFKLREDPKREYNIPSILAVLKGIIGHSKSLESAKSLRKEVKPGKACKALLLTSEQEIDDEDVESSSQVHAVRASRRDLASKKVTWEDRSNGKRIESPITRAIQRE